jgi:hypothetical protein
MAKRRAKQEAPTGQLGDWLEEIPPEVQKCADAYDAAHTAKSKAQAKLNTAKESLIDSMKEHGCKKVRIRNGEKFLELGATDKIAYKKPSEKKPEDQD